MPLQDELRALCAQVGPQVLDDPDTFRGAFDDFVPEGAATTGELRLLIDAIATGSFHRLVAQLDVGADASTAISAEAERLARDRGTVETEGARWALSALAYARGLTGPGSVTTRPSALGVPSVDRPEPERTTAPPGHDRGSTVLPTAPVGPPPPSAASPGATPPAGRRRGRLIAVAVAAAVVLVAGVGAAVVLTDDDGSDSADSTESDGAEGGSGADFGGGTVEDAAPTDLPALPRGHPPTFEFDVRLPDHLRLTVADRFGPGVSTEVYAGGDPTSPEVQADSGPEAAAEQVSELVAAGIPARVKYYALRQVGQGGGDASGQEFLDLLQDTGLMTAYWTNVRDLLTALGGVGAPVELVVEPDVASEVLATTPDATQVATSVAETGVAGLEGLPDTFAGWAQGWVALRDELAPDVRLGVTVAPWQVRDDFLPDLPTTAMVEQWAAVFGESYATLGARFDFLANIMTYAEGGSRGPRFIPDDRFFQRLLTWVGGISAATETRVVLDNVPVGNSVYRTVDDTPYHYRDAWVEWLLGDDDFANLRAMRDAGVIGIVFGVDAGLASMTCPCDAAGDGVTNGGRTGEPSSSPDDDGGYLAERLQAYAAGAPLPL